MKKLLSLYLCLGLCFGLCGCSFKTEGLEKGLESLVAAMGFQQKGKSISIYLETVTVNSEDSEAERSLELIEGSGKSLAEAFEAARLKTVRPFMFSHCAVAVIGEDIDEKRMREICRFLYNKDQINLALRFIYTADAEQLLSCDTVASVAVGYDLVDALDRHTDHSGTVYQNRFYEIEAARKKAVNIFSLPVFTVNDKSYESAGTVVFKNDAPIMTLNSEQTVVYAIATKNQKRGSVLIDNKDYRIKKPVIDYKFSLGDRLKTELTINVELQGEDKPKSKIATVLSELFIESKLKGADIFMLGNILNKEEKELWGRLQHDFYNAYKNSQLAVTVE